jgi:hypothetical protein
MSAGGRIAPDALALTELATGANDEHALAKAAAKTALDHAMQAGLYLAEAKAQLRHGEWAHWLAAHFRGSERTARAYMRLASRREELEAKRQSSADLTIDGALRLLAEPGERAASREARRSGADRRAYRPHPALAAIPMMAPAELQRSPTTSRRMGNSGRSSCGAI